MTRLEEGLHCAEGYMGDCAACGARISYGSGYAVRGGRVYCSGCDPERSDTITCLFVIEGVADVWEMHMTGRIPEGVRVCGRQWPARNERGENRQPLCDEHWRLRYEMGFFTRGLASPPPTPRIRGRRQ